MTPDEGFTVEAPEKASLAEEVYAEKLAAASELAKQQAKTATKTEEKAEAKRKA